MVSEPKITADFALTFSSVIFKFFSCNYKFFSMRLEGREREKFFNGDKVR